MSTDICICQFWIFNLDMTKGQSPNSMLKMFLICILEVFLFLPPSIRISCFCISGQFCSISHRERWPLLCIPRCPKVKERDRGMPGTLSLSPTMHYYASSSSSSSPPTPSSPLTPPTPSTISACVGFVFYCCFFRLDHVDSETLLKTANKLTNNQIIHKQTDTQPQRREDVRHVECGFRDTFKDKISKICEDKYVLTLNYKSWCWLILIDADYCRCWCPQQ